MPTLRPTPRPTGPVIDVTRQLAAALRPPTADRFRLLVGDMRESLAKEPANSIDAVVSDPPYGLSEHPDVAAVMRAWLEGRPYEHSGPGFMGRDWDSFIPGPEFWREVFRVLKPGGHVLAFAGTRTVDLMGVAIRFAGFEVRDQIAWLYGVGFPKSLDVAKAIDKRAGHWRGKAGAVLHENYAMAGPSYAVTPKGDPITEAALEWAGWGSALKPAMEPVIVARKPLVGGLVDNVGAFGTGALNIDAARIGTSGGTRAVGFDGASSMFGIGGSGENVDVGGRWPANVALDEEAAANIDEQAPGASRFFYTSKASTSERELGLHDLPRKPAHELVSKKEGEKSLASPASGAGRAAKDGRANIHPTVKPVDLMQWLVRLVTPPGGVVLDPFCGSGTTGVAAMKEGFRFIGCELETPHACIAWHRIVEAIDDTDPR